MNVSGIFGRKKFGKFTAAIMAAAVAISCEFSALNAFADSDGDFTVEVSVPPKIVFMGDSIAAGYGLDGYTEEDKSKCASYANIISAVFDSALPDEANFTSENVAKDGLTSSAMLKTLKEGGYDSEIHDADAIVVSIGGNDLLSVFFKMLKSDNSFTDIVEQLVSLGDSLDERLDGFESNLPQIVDELHSRSGGSRIFVQTLYNPFDGYKISALDELGDEKIGRLNEIISENSDDGNGGENYIVVDVAKAFADRADELTNIGDMDIHPNADGHAEIARVITPIIEQQTYTYFDRTAQESYYESLEESRLAKRRNAKILAMCGTAAVAVAAVAVGVGLKKHRKNRKDINL